MAYILNIETATRNCSVSVAKDGENVIVKEIATEAYSHAEKLHVFIREALEEANLSFQDLSAIAVSKGPGSYTGLRIGVSAAKGLCFALEIPLISIDTLEVLALQLNASDGIVVPMIDARRMEVYSAVFDTQTEHLGQVKAEIITADSYSGVDEKIHIVGDCQPKIKEVLSAGKFVYHDDIVYPSAREMAAVGFAKFQKSVFEDLAYFEPFYLKDFMIAR